MTLLELCKVIIIFGNFVFCRIKKNIHFDELYKFLRRFLSNFFWNCEYICAGCLLFN